MRVYAFQYETEWENRRANEALVRTGLETVQPPPGSMVVLPELSLLGFTMRRQELAEQPGGQTQRFYSELCQQYGIYLVGGASWWGRDGLGKNMALALNPQGELLGAYCKQHPFSFAGETGHYESGQDFVVFDWRGVKCAPLICYDLRFPETFRHLVRQGVELFLVIANWPTPRVHHWECLLQARAIENQAYVLGVNRCGKDPNVPYPGSSRLIDPQGKVVTYLGDQPDILIGEIDYPELRSYRLRFPALSDLIPQQLGL